MTSTISFEHGTQVKYSSLGHFELALSAGAANLPSIPDENRVRRVVIRPLDADISFTDDGTEPTAGHGMKILAGEVFVYDGRDLSIVRLFCAVTADVRIIYYGT